MNVETALSPNRSSRYGLRPQLMVVHATATSTWQSPYNWLRNGKSGSRRVSAHYLIGKDGRVALLVPEEECAWHAGLSSWQSVPRLGHSINAVSIGYELVNDNRGEPYPEPQINALVLLLRRAAERWTIVPSRQTIVGHYEVSPGRKTDPVGLDLGNVVSRVQRGLHTPTGAWRVRVTASTLLVRQGRGTQYPVAGRLPEGSVVEVADDTDGWLWISSGWGFIAKHWTEPVQ